MSLWETFETILAGGPARQMPTLGEAAYRINALRQGDPVSGRGPGIGVPTATTEDMLQASLDAITPVPVMPLINPGLRPAAVELAESLRKSRRKKSAGAHRAQSQDEKARRQAQKAQKDIDIASMLSGWNPRLDLSGYRLFDYSTLGQGGSEKFSLVRPQPAKSKFERLPIRTQDLVTDDYVYENLRKAVERGEEFYPWYDVSQVGDMFANVGLKPEDFGRYMQYQQAAAQNLPPTKQLQVGNYLWSQDQANLLTPGAEMYFPKGYGSKAQRQIWKNALGIAQGQPIESEKLLSYGEGFRGNWAPATIDTHALRLPAMLSHDPRWIVQSFREINSPLFNPLDWENVRIGKAYTSYSPRETIFAGKLPLSEAINRPAIWEAIPSGSTYGAVEQYLYKPIAEELGISTASAQAGAWVGGGPISGLRSPPKTMLQLFEDEIMRLSDKHNLSPTKAIEEMARGKIY